LCLSFLTNYHWTGFYFRILLLTLNSGFTSRLGLFYY